MGNSIESIQYTINGASIYTTASPCWSCFKLIVNSGMRAIYFGEFYRDERIFRVAEELGVELVNLSSTLKKLAADSVEA